MTFVHIYYDLDCNKIPRDLVPYLADRLPQIIADAIGTDADGVQVDATRFSPQACNQPLIDVRVSAKFREDRFNALEAMQLQLVQKLRIAVRSYTLSATESAIELAAIRLTLDLVHRVSTTLAP